MKTITLQQLHDFFSKAYAVSVNDTLYFVGYECETECPYISDNDGNDYVSFEEVDGDIEITDRNSVFCYVAEQPYEIKFLGVMPVLELSNNEDN